MNLIEATVQVKERVVYIKIESLNAGFDVFEHENFILESGLFVDLYANKLYVPGAFSPSKKNTSEFLWNSHELAVHHAQQIVKCLRAFNDTYF